MWQKLSSSAKGFPTNRTKRVRQSYSFPRCQKATANRPHLEGKGKRASALPWFRKTAPAYSLWAKGVFFGDILVVCKLTPATPPGNLRHTLCASHGQEDLCPAAWMPDVTHSANTSSQPESVRAGKSQMNDTVPRNKKKPEHYSDVSSTGSNTSPPGVLHALFQPSSSTICNSTICCQTTCHKLFCLTIADIFPPTSFNFSCCCYPFSKLL